jgi:hypothetical protein
MSSSEDESAVMMNRMDERQPELPAHNEDGVDLTLIRFMLSLSPAERLEVLQQFVSFVLTARARNAS